MLQTIPRTLAPFFQEYDFERLDVKTAASLIIERALQFGNRAELHWLFEQYPRAQIAEWFKRYAKERLPDPHKSFWRIVLEIDNGYGFPLVAPLLEMEGIRLASVADIALMKLDTLLSRAARKDFYDLYFICQKTPLRQLLELAPKKYSNVRDFEVQVVKRLVYFENAEADVDPVFLQPVSWQTVIDFFIQQAREIGSTWL